MWVTGEGQGVGGEGVATSSREVTVGQASSLGRLEETSELVMVGVGDRVGSSARGKLEI